MSPSYFVVENRPFGRMGLYFWLALSPSKLMWGGAEESSMKNLLQKQAALTSAVDAAQGDHPPFSIENAEVPILRKDPLSQHPQLLKRC